jgi:hypothetical protein
MVAAEDGDVTIIIDGEGTCSALEARARCLGVWIRSSNLQAGTEAGRPRRKSPVFEVSSTARVREL